MLYEKQSHRKQKILQITLVKIILILILNARTKILAP